MSTNKKSNPKIHPTEEITIGNISGGTGIAIGTGAHVAVMQNTGVREDAITIAFQAIRQAVAAMPDGPHKDTATNTVKALELEARKGPRADETKTQKWINFLAEIAPDIWEVAIDTFINPIKGIGTIFKKIAEKERNEKEKSLVQRNI